MIYLNHAGTSWPKPDSVLEAAARAYRYSALESAARLEEDYVQLAEAFATRPSELLITPGCTAALHVAIADQPWQAGDTLLIGAFEHLSVERPARALEGRGVEVVVAPPGPGGAPVDLDFVEERLDQPGVRLAVFSWASNVTGALHPVGAIQRWCRAAGVPLLVDAAQVVGWLDIDLNDFDIVAFGSHKGLQGPWGLGGLYIRADLSMSTPRAGARMSRPSFCDVGSVDRSALAGVVAGLEWLAGPRQATRLDDARGLAERLQVALARWPSVSVLGPQAPEERIPTVAFTVTGDTPSAVAQRMAAHGVQVSAGTQCAPLAHETLGTLEEGGAVRVSFGPSSHENDLQRLLDVLPLTLGPIVD